MVSNKKEYCEVSKGARIIQGLQMKLSNTHVQLRPWVVGVVNELSNGNKTFRSRMRNHSQRHIKPRALSTVTHSALLEKKQKIQQAL